MRNRKVKAMVIYMLTASFLLTTVYCEFPANATSSVSENTIKEIVSANSVNINVLDKAEIVVNDNDGVIDGQGYTADTWNYILNEEGGYNEVMKNVTEFPILAGYEGEPGTLNGNGEPNLWNWEEDMMDGALFDNFNAARVVGQTYYWPINNIGEPIVYNSGSTITRGYEYDYELERVAKQRALEQSLVDGHQTTYVLDFVHAYWDVRSYYCDAQNRRELTYSIYPVRYEERFKEEQKKNPELSEPTEKMIAKWVVDDFLEADATCSSQAGHRAAIYDDNLNRIGIACINHHNGVYTVVVEIARDHYCNKNNHLVSDFPSTDVCKWDGQQCGLYIPQETSRINVKRNMEQLKDSDYGKAGTRIKAINKRNGDLFSICNMQTSDDWTIKVGDKIQTGNILFGMGSVPILRGNDDYFTWESTDESCVKIENGAIIGLKDNTEQGWTVVYAVTPNGTKIGRGIIINALEEDIEKESAEKESAVNTDVKPEVTENVKVEADTSDVVVPQSSTATISVSSKAKSTVLFYKGDLKKKAKSFSLGAKASNGNRVKYRVTKYPKNGKKYIKVSSKGKVTLKKGAPAGTYRIRLTASMAEVKYVTVKVTSKAKIVVASKCRDTITYKASSVKKRSYKVSIGAKSSNKKKVQYKVYKYPKGAKKYIKVSSKGVVTLKKRAPKGTYKIKVYAKGAQSQYVTLKVK